MSSSPSKDAEDALAGTLEAIMLEQVQLPWQSRMARWQYRQDHLAALIDAPEPEQEPEPEQQQEPGEEESASEEETSESGEEQESMQEKTVGTLGEAQAAAMRAAETTHRIQTAHMNRYGDCWRDQRVFTVPGREASLLQREAPLPSFSMWRAEKIESLASDAVSGSIGPTVQRMRQQEELLLSRLNALEGAAELRQWCGDDNDESQALIKTLRTALRAVQEQIEPRVRELAKTQKREAPMTSCHQVSAPPEVARSPAPTGEPPDWSEVEQALDRAAHQLEKARAVAQAPVQAEPAMTTEALRRQAEHVRSETAQAEATEQSVRLRRRHEQLQHAVVRWRQDNEFLPAGELLLGPS